MNANSTRLINRVAARDFALATLAKNRPHLAAKLTRVSGEFYEQAQAALTNWIVARVMDAPSCGKTLR